ncbi:MAG: ribbon-helix-helix domain-containing protein [Bacillota bacterium]
MNAKVILKNRVQIGSSVDKAIWKRFQDFSKKTRIPVSKLLDEAMENLLKKYQNNS